MPAILLDAKADSWAEALSGQLANAFDPAKHGALASWSDLLRTIPEKPSRYHCLDAAEVRIGRTDELDNAGRDRLEQQLRSLHPWRKGPYRLFGIDIDAEWRSDWKWDRLKDHVAPLTRRLVLDVGCGNGYHCWRMLGAGAKAVIGIDPLLLNVVQFLTIKKIFGQAPIYVLPLGMEDLPYGLNMFDTVFSMGVLYHRRSPIDHLMELKASLRKGGELVLETLVIDGDANAVLLPEDRYAKMRNVWFLPSCAALVVWLKRCGFINIRLIDVTATTGDEQRSTAWMHFQSLTDFLHPNTPALTYENLPAPKRAILIANSP